MNEIINKIKSMNKITLAIGAFFVVAVIANLLGYGG
jgi:hypothetical protein